MSRRTARGGPEGGPSAHRSRPLQSAGSYPARGAAHAPVRQTSADGWTAPASQVGPDGRIADRSRCEAGPRSLYLAEYHGSDTSPPRRLHRRSWTSRPQGARSWKPDAERPAGMSSRPGEPRIALPGNQRRRRMPARPPRISTKQSARLERRASILCLAAAAQNREPPPAGRPPRASGVLRGGAAISPSRIAVLRACLRERRTASAASRTRFSEGFS